MAARNPVSLEAPLDGVEFDHLGFSEGRVDNWLWSLTGLGLALRLLVYLLRPPIWTDEAKLAVSLLDRGYSGLLEPLAYSQIAPVLFMWLQKSVTLGLGFSEYSLRFVPLLAAIASVLLMRHMTRRLLVGAPAIFALALFAVSYYPVRHAAELKPYATDLLVSLVLTALAVEWLSTARARWLWILAAAAPVAVALSYPASFVTAGVLVALAISAWQQRDWRAVLASVLGGLSAGVVFSLQYFLIGAAHRDARLATQAVWPGGFPQLDDPIAALGWLASAHTGRTFGYPLGGENGGSILTFVAFAAGVLVLLKAARYRFTAVLLLPFVAGLGAAVVQQYPYGGSGRVSQHLVPAICILAGLGAARLTSLAKSASRKRRVQTGVLVALVLFGLLLAIAAVVRPYRDRPDMVARGFARWFWESESRDAVLVDAWEDLRLEFARPDDYWIPGGAGYRINQRIYFDRRKRGLEPKLEDVATDHPLRVVFLWSSTRAHGEALDEWLREMEIRYELVGERRHFLGGFAEQHGEGDWVRVFSFVLRE